MGGTQGVFLAAYADAGPLSVLGEPVASRLSDTFARSALDSTMLIVASPAGFETYDLNPSKDTGPWLMSALAEPSPQTFASGASVACP
jgi:hypothetical protein